MIRLKNTQRKISIDTSQLKQDVQILLDALDYTDYDIGIWLCSNATMREYNKTYRDKDKVTDILSFPFYPDLKPGQRIKPLSPDEKNLGDIIIAPAYVQEDLPRWDTTFKKRMQVLLVHGICHLLGYDHIKDSDYQVMKKKEAGLLKKLQ